MTVKEKRLTWVVIREKEKKEGIKKNKILSLYNRWTGEPWSSGKAWRGGAVSRVIEEPYAILDLTVGSL